MRTWKNPHWKKGPECKECGKAFRVKPILQKHTKTHTGEGPYKGKECERAFINPISLKTQYRKHTGEKPISML